jgi:hypothetical protein
MGAGAAAAGTAMAVEVGADTAGVMAAGAGMTAAGTAAGVSMGTAAAAAAGTAAAGVSAASILSTVGQVGTALGGVVGAIGQVNAAEAAGASSKYAAEVAANNQTIAKQNTDLAGAAGASAIEQQGIKTKEAVGAIEAAQAASNIDVNSGSALDVRSSRTATGTLDALTLRANTEKQVYGYQTAATSFAGQESLSKAAEAQAPAAAALGASTSLLSGATGVASQYSQWMKTAGNSGGTSPLGLFT